MEDGRSQKESRNNPPQTEDWSWKSQEEAQAVDSSAMEEKVSSLRDSINSLNEEVSSHSENEKWSTERKLYSREAIDKLHKEVKQLEEEWNKLSDDLNRQSQRIEALFSSFPDATDISTMKLLSLRMNQQNLLYRGQAAQTPARAGGGHGQVPGALC